MRSTYCALLVLLAWCACSAASDSAAHTAPEQSIPVKVVVLAAFELGADTGDTPGEFQYWVEREKLQTVLPFPAGVHDLRMNQDGVLGVVTGVGPVRSAATIMALGLDPRFDLRHAYWIVAGIAGVNPRVASLGSAAWAEWVVDGDLAHEIDGREIPADWKTGFVPLRKSVPYEEPHDAEQNGMVFHLNPALTQWAYEKSKSVALEDTNDMRDRRMQFAGEAAHQPPFVLKGDEISAATFWHGKELDAWATDWVRYQTDGKARYVTTAMEDSGTLEALAQLAKAGRVDMQRVMVLRTASNFDQQREGISAAQSLAETKIAHYSAYLPSLEAAYRVGDAVVREVLTHWSIYRDSPPR